MKKLATLLTEQIQEKGNLCDAFSSCIDQDATTCNRCVLGTGNLPKLEEVIAALKILED